MSEISAYREGVKFEQERIIKLIEAQDKWNDHFWTDEPDQTTCDCYGCEDIRQLIALIKGEE